MSGRGLYLARHSGNGGKCRRSILGSKGDQVEDFNNPDEQLELKVVVGVGRKQWIQKIFKR